ncbi:MAG: CvpA family protein [Oscillospiraceae bacterium]|nr:CvpA family protein [Oscillospiraceae bacterium]
MNWVVGIVLDLILIAFVVILCRKGSKDGFAKTVVGFLGFFIALVLAGLLCRPTANLAYTGFVQKPIESTIENTIRNYTDEFQESAPSAQQLLDGIEQALNEAPKFLKDALKLEEKRQELSDKIVEVYTTDITAFSQEITETVVKPAVISAISAVAFVVLFIILSLVCALLAKSLKLVNKLPLLGSLNSLLGGVLGALKGVIIVIVLNWLLVALVGDSGNLFGIITPKTIESSLIMKNLAAINPLNMILSSVMPTK